MRRPVRVLLVAVFLPVPLLAGLIAAGVLRQDGGGKVGPAPPAARAAYTPAGTERLDVGDGARGAVIFRASGGDQAPRPVVVLVPARDAGDPRPYGAWIGHLVHRGATVIYPTNAGAPSPDGAGRLPNLLAGVRAALAHARAAPGRLIVAGDEVGGGLAVDVAATARGHGVPAPSAVLSVYPVAAPSAQLGSIAVGTRVHVLIPEWAGAAGRRSARRIAREALRARVTVEVVRDDAVQDRAAARRSDIAARRTFWRPLDALVAATGRTAGGRAAR